MKKILTLLLLFIPLFAYGQNWYKANSVRFEFSDGKKIGWRECKVRVFIDENRNVKIFTLEETHIYRVVDDEYIHKVDENGNATIYWKTLDEKGERCVIYYMHDKYVSFLYLGLKYNHLKVWYDMKPDN